jgi:EAL domain-containing protein (putative c-di-GMP-specific phosphodiesterase class I)
MRSAERLVELEHVERPEQTPRTLPRDDGVFFFDDTCLQVCFQPKQDVHSGRAGFEALTRGMFGSTAPTDLFARAEQNGTIRGLTNEVLRCVCAQHAACREAGLTVPISLNVSPTELDQEFVHGVRAVLEEFGADASMIELEITEGHPLDQPEQLEALRALHDLGFRLGFDDFGSGFATAEALAALKEQGVDFDTVKLDMTLMEQGRAASEATTLIGLGYHVVAEGVERAEQAAELPDACVRQGHFAGETVPAHQLVRTLRQ